MGCCACFECLICLVDFRESHNSADGNNYPQPAGEAAGENEVNNGGCNAYNKQGNGAAFALFKVHTQCKCAVDNHVDKGKPVDENCNSEIYRQKNIADNSAGFELFCKFGLCMVFDVFVTADVAVYRS